MAWGGQFGTPGFGQGNIPPNIIKQYPGTQNIRQGEQMYGNLLYGPLSNAYNITSAQAADPAAQEFQQNMEYGGGAFAPPGAGTAQLGKLFAGQTQAFNKGQAVKGQQQGQAMQGMQDTLDKYAQDMYTTQSAALTLDEAKAQQQAEQQGAIIDLGAMVASVASGSPIPMELAGVLTQNSGGIGNPQTAQAFSQLGGQGGLFNNWFGGGSAAQQFYPTSGSYGTIDPNAVDPSVDPTASYYSGIDFGLGDGGGGGGGAAYLPGMFANAGAGGLGA